MPGRQFPFRSPSLLDLGKKITLWFLVTTINVILGLKSRRAHASVGGGCEEAMDSEINRSANAREGGERQRTDFE